MVNTSCISVFMSGMDKHDRSSDTESECSVPEVLSRDQIDELDDGTLIRTDYNLEQRSIDQRFSDMNKQISDLTGLVLALTEKLSSNVGEGNNQSTASDKTCARSDKYGKGNHRFWVSIDFGCFLPLAVNFSTIINFDIFSNHHFLGLRNLFQKL